ncbi:A-kinase anchoring protein 7 [Gastrophryne carolinensis]
MKAELKILPTRDYLDSFTQRVESAFKKDLSDLQQSVGNLDTRVHSLEQFQTATTRRLEALERDLIHQKVVTQAAVLHLEDLENRTSRNNIRVRAFEGRKPDKDQRKKKKNKPKKQRSCSNESGKSLLRQLPFADVDIGAVFEITRSVEKMVKKKRKRHQLESEDDDKGKKQKRANYFVSLPITNSKIHEDIQTIQDTVIKKDNRLTKAMVPKGSYHITLFVMYLAVEEDVDLAAKALMESKKLVEEILQGRVLVLSFCGLSDFKHEVVFAQTAEGDPISTLKQITEMMAKIFEEKGISVTGSKSFVPHLTLMKLSRAPKLRKQGMKKIDQSLYKEFENHSFGEEVFHQLDLCSMLKKRGPSGYYHTEASIVFGRKNGREPDDAELVSLSKKLVENAVLKAVQQYIEETQQGKTKQTDGISLEPGNNEKIENNIK